MGASYGKYQNDELWLEVGDKQYIVDVDASCSYWFQPAKMYLSNGDPGYPEDWELELTDVAAEWHDEDMNKVEPLEDFSRVNRHPKWLSKESEERYKGCASIHGNFKRVSHAFSILTDDEKLVAEFEDLFKKNKEIKNGNPF